MRNMLALLVLVALVATVPSARAAGRQRLTARDLVGIKVPSSLAASRDGRTIAFTVSEPDFERSRENRDLYIARVDGGASATRRMTHTPDADEHDALFSPDGRTLAFLSTRKVPKADEEASSDDEPKTQIWIMPIDGGEARPLTSAEEGVFAFDWMPDAKAIVFTAREVLPKAEQERKAADKKRKVEPTVEDREQYRREVWRVEVESGKATRIAPGDFGVGEIRVSPDGREVAYDTTVTGRPDDDIRSNLWVLDLGTGAARQLTTRGGGVHQPRWSADGASIAFVAWSDPRYDYSRVDAYVIPRAGGEAADVSKALDRSVEQIAWAPADRVLYGTVVDGANQPLYRFAAGAAPARVDWPDAFVAEVLPLAGGAVAAVVESATRAPEVAVLAGAKATELTALNAELRDREIARTELIRWKGADGLDVEGVLVYPVDYRPGTRVPLVLAIHGGPFGRTPVTLRSDYYHPQLWAANGYAVLLPNFRGSDGYGDAFGQANRMDLGGQDYKDIMAGVDKVVAMGVADPERMGVMGLSYGGYMTNWIISQTDRFKGAISESGIFNLVTDYSNSNIPSWEVEYLNGFYWERENLALYLERSPFKYVDRIETPVLILHGDEDPNTFISNSKEMYQALKALGRTVEFVHFPREEHGFEEPNHRVDEATRWVAWFSKYVKRDDPSALVYETGAYAPAGDWEYTVASVEGGAEYAGRRATGRYVEVTILLRGEAAKSRPADVAVSDVALRLADGRELRPVGAVMAGGGARALVAPDVRVHAESGAAAEGRTYVPLVVAFDVPADAGRATVRLGSYAAFEVEVGE